MSYLGDYDASTVIYGKFTTFRPSTGAAYTLGGTPALSVYKDNSTTQSTTGVTLTADFDSVTGLNHFAIDTSADGTFYSAGSNFDIVITTGTVDSVSVVGSVVGRFSLRKNSSLKPTTAGRTLDVSSGGEAGVDWANVGSPTTTLNLSGTTVKAVTDRVTANTDQWNGTAVTSATVRSDLINIAGVAVSTSTAQLGVNVVNFGGSAGTFSSGRPEVNTSHIGGSTTPVTNIGTVFNTDFATNYNTTIDMWNVNVENWNTTAVPAEHTAGYPIVTIKDGTGTGEINTNAGAIALVDLVTTTTTATNVTTVNGLAAGVITAAAIATDAIDADALAADAIAEINATVDTALADINLDHLVKNAVDTNFATTVHLDSVIGHLADAGTTATFDRTTDALEVLGAATAPSAATIADAVWDEDLSGHLSAGSTGEALNAAGSAGDPWTTTLPGSYTGSQAGKILADILVDTGTTLDGLIQTVDTVVDAIKVKTDYLPSATAGAAGGVFIAGSNAATTVNITGNITGNLSGSVGSVTGAVGSVTGNVGGNVTGSVGSISGITFPTNFGSTVISAGGVVSADTVAVSGDSTAADSLESYLDGTHFMPVDAHKPVFSISGATLTVKRPDGTTTAYTRTLTTSASADPVTGSS